MDEFQSIEKFSTVKTFFCNTCLARVLLENETKTEGRKEKVQSEEVHFNLEGKHLNYLFYPLQRDFSKMSTIKKKSTLSRISTSEEGHFTKLRGYAFHALKRNSFMKDLQGT